MCKMRHQPAILLHDRLSAWREKRITMKEKSGRTYISACLVFLNRLSIYMYMNLCRLSESCGIRRFQEFSHHLTCA